MRANIVNYDTTSVGLPEGRILTRVSTMNRTAQPAQTFWLDTVKSHQDLVERSQERAGHHTIAWIDFFAQGIQKVRVARQLFGQCACNQALTEIQEERSSVEFMPGYSLVLTGNDNRNFDYVQMQKIREGGVPQYTEKWLDQYYAPSPGRFQVGPQPFNSPTTLELRAMQVGEPTSQPRGGLLLERFHQR